MKYSYTDEHRRPLEVRCRSALAKRILAKELAEADPEFLRFLNACAKARGPVEEVRWEYDDEARQDRLRQELENATKSAAAHAVAKAKKTLGE